jgi:hypothetical protein
LSFGIVDIFLAIADEFEVEIGLGGLHLGLQ